MKVSFRENYKKHSLMAVTMAVLCLSVLTARADGPDPISDTEASAIENCAHKACSAGTSNAKSVTFDLEKMETMINRYKSMGATKVGVSLGAKTNFQGEMDETVLFRAYSPSGTGFRVISDSANNHGELCSPTSNPPICRGCPAGTAGCP